MLMVDFMHSDLGPWIVANVLLELVEEGHFGNFVGDWKSRNNFALRVAWLKFKEWAKNVNIQHSQGQFSLTKLSMATQNSWPEFKGKWHNTCVITLWLHHVLANEAPCGTDREKARAALLEGYAIVRTTITSSGPQLNDYDAHLVLSAAAKKEIEVGKAEGDAANIQPEERRQLWMQYLRSRKSTKRESFANGNQKKMPPSMKNEVDANLEKYFKIWLKCKKIGHKFAQ